MNTYIVTMVRDGVKIPVSVQSNNVPFAVQNAVRWLATHGHGTGWRYADHKLIPAYTTYGRRVA